ncbi:MAG: sugar ABC transporter ATP-binding protein [Cellulomonadaceae bacterium]
MAEPVLEMRHVTKVYPGVVALNDVSMEFRPGEVHAIVGENGAGKSTFIKTITGAIAPSRGELVVDGQVVRDNSPQRSLGLGIAAIYQEFSLIPFLSVAENIFFGRMPRRGVMIDRAAMIRMSREVLAELGVEIDPRTLIKDLSVGYQQLVEIARAISRDARVLIMDEPSAPLTESEMVHLYRIVETLRSRGVAIIYISHRMEEIFRICDVVSVLRDGCHVTTLPVADADEDELIRLMVDRAVSRLYPGSTAEPGRVVLEARGLTTGFLKDVSLTVRAGEIVGIAGLVGAGRTELARAVFGADKRSAGEVVVDGVECHISSPEQAVACGIGLIPEDRKSQGLLMNMDIRENVVFAAMEKVSRHGVIDRRRETEVAERYTEAMRVRAPSVRSAVAGLSGGNQQKVVLAKWLMTDCRVVFFDEPTRGIDVGAKQEIYDLMRELGSRGAAIVMISSELPELLGMADRIVVMHAGRVTGELSRLEATPERVIALSSKNVTASSPVGEPAKRMDRDLQ